MNRELLKERFIEYYQGKKLQTGQFLFLQEYKNEFLNMLEPVDQDQMPEIIQELINEGYVAEEERGLKLLEKGYDCLYEVRPKDELEEDVLSYIKGQKGFVYEHVLISKLRDIWNPKEQQLYGVIIDGLIKVGKIEEKASAINDQNAFKLLE